MAKFCIVDGYGFVFRAYHSLPPLTTQDGTPVGAVYGFANMLLKLIKNNNIEHITIALDAGKKSFRHDIYPEYKANRPEAPEDLIPQFPIVREMIEAFNIIAIEKVGFEADDIIATLAKKASNQGFDVEIISSDKDLMQLVDESVRMYDAFKDIKIDAKRVKEKFSIEPNQVRDYLALVGDVSDNIPGVKGIGAKSAIKLLEQFGNLKNLLSHTEAIENARQQSLIINGKENAELSYKLVGLNENVEDCSIDVPRYSMDTEKLVKFLSKYNFRSLITRVDGNALSNPDHLKQNNVNVKKVEIASVDELKKLIDDIIRAGELAILNNETNLEILFNEQIITIKYQLEDDLFSEQNSITQADVKKFLGTILANESVKKLFADVKQFLKHWQLPAKSYEDIAVMAYTIYTGLLDCTKLGNIAIHFEIEDSEPTLIIKKLYSLLLLEFLKEKSFSLYENIDKPLIACLIAVENKGILLDNNLLNDLALQFKKDADNLEKQIHELVGEEFNIGSPKQLGEILFDKMQFPYGKKNKSGSYGTGADILEKLAADGYKIANLILEWRQLTKLITTYTNTLLTYQGSDKRIRTNFNAIKTSTSRLSSHDPNLQNIPIRSAQGNQIRKAFIAAEENLLVSADYSQIELRLLAEMANIKELKEAFKSNQDIHKITAMQIFDTEDITPELRRQAKMINFGILYGISSYGLAQRLGITSSAAKQHIDNYFHRFPKIKQYMDDAIDYARKHGYVKTVIGRKCYIKDINSKQFAKRSFAERAAINAPLQGSNADIIKIAMINLPQEIKSYLILQIHDELLFEIPKNKVKESAAIIQEVMEGAIGMHLKVDIKAGLNWAESTKNFEELL